MKSSNNYKLSLKKDWLSLLLAISLITIVVSVLILGTAYLVKRSRDNVLNSNPKKIEQFKENKELICTTNSNIFSNATIVDRESGWSVYDAKYFKKNAELINIVNCNLVTTKGEE